MTLSLHHSASISQILEPSPQGLISSVKYGLRLEFNLPNAIVLISQQASRPPKKPRAHPVPVGQKGSNKLSPTRLVINL